MHRVDLLSEFKFICRRISDLEEEVLLLKQRMGSNIPHEAEASDRPNSSALAISSSPRGSRIETDSSANPGRNTISTDITSTRHPSTNVNSGLSPTVIISPSPRMLTGFELGSDFIRDLFTL